MTYRYCDMCRHEIEPLEGHVLATASPVFVNGQELRMFELCPACWGEFVARLDPVVVAEGGRS